MIIILFLEHSFQHPGISGNEDSCNSVLYSETVKYFK